MILNTDVAQKVADSLLQIKAIKLNLKNPFLWASGWKSPIYCDNRIVLSFPSLRGDLARYMAEQIKVLYPDVQVIAGVATGAIGIGLLVAEKLQLPFVYIRPEAKKHGRKNQIEGMLTENQRVVVVEDLISTGMSSLKAVEALRESQGNVLGMVAIFSYGFDAAQQSFIQSNVKLNVLCDYNTLITRALYSNYISDQEINSLAQWRKNPQNWNQH